MNQTALFNLDEQTPLFAGVAPKVDLPPTPKSWAPFYSLKLVRERDIAYEARSQFRSPADIAHILMPYFSECHTEHMLAVAVDTKMRLIGVNVVFTGSLNTAVITMREIFKPLISMNADSFIVAHVHPSGDPTPSPEDVRVTEMIADAGRLMDIELLDHLVFGHNRFVSLKERGLGFA